MSNPAPDERGRVWRALRRFAYHRKRDRTTLCAINRRRGPSRSSWKKGAEDEPRQRDTVAGVERLTFKMADAFSPDDPIAVWVMTLSIALGDLRIVAEYATRTEQPEHERIYFVRTFSSHLREIAKLLVHDFQRRKDVRHFVAALPQEAQDAREEADALLHSTFPLRPGAVVWEDLKRLRDDTFHYASDGRSQERLVDAMRTVAGMRKGELEASYVLDDTGWLRAEYADLVIANRMHPFAEEHEDDEELPITSELHETIINLNRHVASFLAAAEAHYLLDVLEPGVVTHHRD